MKKYFLLRLIALCAVTANLLLPGLAFSQEDQVVGVEVACGPWGITLGASSFEMEIMQQTPSMIRAFGSTIGGKTYQDGSNTIPGEATIKIEDYRTEEPGCAEAGVDGWRILVDYEIGSSWSDGHGHTYQPSDFKIINTMNFDATATGANIDSTYSIQGSSLWTQFWYPNTYTGPYNIQSNMNTDSSKDLTDYHCFVWQNCDGASYISYNNIQTAGWVQLITNGSGVGDGSPDRYKDVTLYSGMAYYVGFYPTWYNASSYPYTTSLEFTMEIID